MSNSCHCSKNGRCSGQFVLGEPLNRRNRRHRLRLRTVSELFPEVIGVELDGDGLPSYSAVEALERQEPFVNPTLANHALARAPVPAQSLRRKTGRVSRGRVPGLPEVQAGFQDIRVLQSPDSRFCVNSIRQHKKKSGCGLHGRIRCHHSVRTLSVKRQIWMSWRLPLQQPDDPCWNVVCRVAGFTRNTRSILIESA